MLRRLLSHSILCCRRHQVRDEDQLTIADQLEEPQQHPHQLEQQQLESQTDSHTIAIIMPKQEQLPQQELPPHVAAKRVAWTADRMLKRHTRRRASHSPAQLKEMCINVEIHHAPPEAPTDTETQQEAANQKPIADGVEIFPADTVAILHLATNETEADTDTDTGSGSGNQQQQQQQQQTYM